MTAALTQARRHGQSRQGGVAAAARAVQTWCLGKTTPRHRARVKAAPRVVRDGR
jgi:hypothetical protein